MLNCVSLQNSLFGKSKTKLDLYEKKIQEIKKMRDIIKSEVRIEVKKDLVDLKNSFTEIKKKLNEENPNINQINSNYKEFINNYIEQEKRLNYIESKLSTLEQKINDKRKNSIFMKIYQNSRSNENFITVWCDFASHKIAIDSSDMVVQDLIRKYAKIANKDENNILFHKNGRYLLPKELLSKCDITAGSIIYGINKLEKF